MRIMKIKRVVALAVLLSVAGLTVLGYTYDSPSNEEVAFAQKTSDLMLNELLAALFKEFDTLDGALAWARHLQDNGLVALAIDGDDGTSLSKQEIVAALRHSENERVPKAS